MTGWSHPLSDERDISLASYILNALWLVLGGAIAAVGWFVAALIMAISIVGLPWAKAAFDVGLYTLWPFGVRARPGPAVGRPNALGGALATVGNLIWLVLAGWWLALAHLVAALCLAITIVGLPFAWAHLKRAGFALWPMGRALVSA